MMLEMTHKLHRKHHRRFSGRRQIVLLAGISLFVALALLVTLLWLVNKP